MRQTKWKSILSFCVLALKTQRSSQVPMYRGSGSSLHGEAEALETDLAHTSQESNPFVCHNDWDLNRSVDERLNSFQEHGSLSGREIQHPGESYEISDVDLMKYGHFFVQPASGSVLSEEIKAEIDKKQIELFESLELEPTPTEPRIHIGRYRIRKEIAVAKALKLLFNQMKEIQTHVFGFSERPLDFQEIKDGHIEMIQWVVGQILKPNDEGLLLKPEAEWLGAKKDPEFDAQELVKLQKKIITFLNQPSNDDMISIPTGRNSSVRIRKENAQACEVAFHTLRAYYKRANNDRWQRSFRSDKGFSSMVLKSFIIPGSKKDNSSRQRAKCNFFGVTLVPWSEE